MSDRKNRKPSKPPESRGKVRQPAYDGINGINQRGERGGDTNIAESRPAPKRPGSSGNGGKRGQ